MIPMRKLLQKAACALLALCLCAGLTACYNEEDTWAAKSGDDVMPIGAYIYYLSSAYAEAGDLVSANEKVLQGEIDGQSVKDWVKERALAYVGSYYYIRDKFDELGLTLADEDLQAIENGTSAYWPYYKDGMEAMGISEESFKKAYAEHNVRAQLVLQALYGEGGEKAVAEDELWAYYQENYDSYEYMYVSKSKMDEDNKSVALTDEEKELMLDSLNELAGQVNSGSISLSEAYTQYSYIAMTTPQHEAPGAAKKSGLHPNIASALPDMKDNEAKVIEVDTGCYLLQKLPLEEHFQSLLKDESEKEGLLVEVKGTEFNDEALEQGKALAGVEVNQKAIGRIKVETVVTNKDETGGSVAPSDDNGSSAAEATESKANAE